MINNMMAKKDRAGMTTSRDRIGAMIVAQRSPTG
jgi:hypothetical protein